MILPVHRKMTVTICLLILVSGLWGRMAAQSGRVRPTGQNQSEDKIQLSVEEVLIPINVKSTSSQVPPDVSVGDFLVTEGGKQQKVTAVMRAPANILLLIDASGNITQRKNLQINREIAEQIVKSIHDEDQVAVVTYGEKVTLLCPWTSDKSKLKEALLSSFRPGLRSNLSEGILYSADKIMSQVNGRRSFILFTDGIDSFVPKWTDDAIVALQRSRASVYIISPNAAIMAGLKEKAYYTGDWYDRIDPKVRRSTNVLRDYYHQLENAAATLKDLTKELDGMLWNLEKWPETIKETKAISGTIMSEFETEYLIAYRAERRPDNQEFLPVQVVPTRQDISIRVQSGVYVNHKN